MAIELHEETQCPKVTGRFRRVALISAKYAVFRVFHYRIVSSVQELNAELFQKQSNAQGGCAFAPRI